MNYRAMAIPLLAAAAFACSSTGLHPYKGHGSYAVVVAPSALAQTQPLIDQIRPRVEYLDVLTDLSQTRSRYRAIVDLRPIANGYAYEVHRFDFPTQKGVVTDAADLDRLIDDAVGNRRPHPTHGYKGARF